MKNATTPIAGRHVARAAAILMALVLSACGGGGGSPGTVSGSGGSTGGGTGTGTGTGTGGSTVTAAPAVTVAFTSQGGAASTTLSSATPLTVSATVLDKDKKPVSGAIVTFGTANTLAVFSPTNGTALTDANGVAKVTMRAASLAAGGAGTVTATTSVADTTITGTANYAVGSTSLSFGPLKADPATLQAYGTTVLSVDVLSGSAKFTNQQVNVTFSSDCASKDKATLSTTVTTNNGSAQAVYRDKGCAGPDVITVSSDAVSQTAATTITVAPPAAASVQFVGASPNTQSIVIRGQGGSGRTETATLTFRVVDTSGNPLSGKTVNFTTTSPDVVLNKLTDTTDASGNVITTVNSGNVATTFRVQATLPNTTPSISTLSDSVVVTNGLPTQAAFSVGPESFNVEGWTLNTSGTNPATHVTVSLGDRSGNLVPDGTPIVFSTNLGAIGTSGSGGCNTVNGSCSVDFRAQNPRSAQPGQPATACNKASPDSTRVGLATICASTTDGSTTLFGKTFVFLSGSSAPNTFMNGALVSFDALHPNDLGTVKSSETKVFQLQFNDVNFNPMPSGSRVEITSMLNGNAAAVVPATVPAIAPHNASGDDTTGNAISGNQGSTHTFSISSTQPTECKNPTQASFNVTVTAPGGSTTNIPFKLSFSCP